MVIGIREVRKLVSEKFEDYKFIVISNREPYTHFHTDGDINCSMPTGGLTAALDPVLQATGGVWIAGGSGDADREVVDKDNCIRVPPDEPKYVLRRV